ncbi:MAG TPA: dihydroneopterin aldolase [Sulfurovum sp.]|nr:dihydroneopterin aldolase [Sulfurovum sp.]
MTIHIESLTFEVIIGLLDFERERPQRVIVDLEASYDYTDANFVNYAEMASDIASELKEKKYKLLEDALLGIKYKLHTDYPQLKKLQLKIAKPDILPECSVALSNTWEF